jgi:hypothetical protein
MGDCSRQVTVHFLTDVHRLWVDVYLLDTLYCMSLKPHEEVCDKCKVTAGTSGHTCCMLSPRTLSKRVVVNNLSRTDEVGIGCSLLSGQLEDIQDGPVLRILVLM